MHLNPSFFYGNGTLSVADFVKFLTLQGLFVKIYVLWDKLTSETFIGELDNWII